MFKSNTQKEVFYIFVWLVGIILFYTLVFTFILEPSQDKSEPTHTEHLIHIVSKEKTPTKASIAKPTILKKIKTSIQEPLKNNINKQTQSIPKKDLKSTKLQTISTPSIPKVVEIPKNTLSTPSVPSVPTIPSVKKENIDKKPLATTNIKSTTHTKEVNQDKKENIHADKMEKALSKEENIKHIETQRQQVIQEAEAIREEAIRLLEK